MTTEEKPPVVLKITKPHRDVDRTNIDTPQTCALEQFEQRLWRVDYPAYGLAPTSSETGSQALVPRRIDMTYGALTLKLTIDDWQRTILE